MSPRSEVESEIFDDKILYDTQKSGKLPPATHKISWKAFSFFISTHIGSIYGLYLLLTAAKWQTNLFAIILYYVSVVGNTAGAHRLWSHRSFKAKLPLRIILAIFQTIGLEYSILFWARNHRVHHKHSDTDSDPHNSKRGFFFSHIGWAFVEEHPDMVAAREKVDISDLLADPVVRFQDKHYLPLVIVACFIMPTIFPYNFWGETVQNAFFLCGILRHTLSAHGIFLINSVAHMWGMKPYDQSIEPTQNLTVSIFALGEGWHNYHHAFPWDYKASELGTGFNLSKNFINFFAKIGWAYDLKTVSQEILEKRIKRTGDGSHAIWGWGDKDQDQEEIKSAKILHRK